MTLSPYRLVLQEDHASDQPWILKIYQGDELQGTVRFESDDDRNEFMRQFQRVQ